MQQPPNQYPQYPQQQWNPQQSPFPPQQYQPSMLPPKKSRKGLFIVLGVRNGIVWVTDVGAWNANPNDYTWGVPMIQLDCFNIQQAIWYGLKSTINADGSSTIIKSDFKEVDITFLTTFLANAKSFASCRLTSPTVDKIDKAGIWTASGSVDAWAMYDSASIQ